ncbi:MAG: hypothetical protein AAGA76_01580, partial [Pseudomonadota bacterium]
MTDVGAILTSIGQASYVWDINEDTLDWSANFRDLAGFKPDIDISCAREFEKLLSTDSQQTRFAVIQSDGQTKVD